MRLGISGSIVEDCYDKFERRSIDTMPVRPVKRLDDTGPIQIRVLRQVRQ